MPTILPTKSLYYDDVNLIAQPQFELTSRSEVPKQLDRIIVSPMEAVVGRTFALEAYRLGLTVCLHRFDSMEKQLDKLNAIRSVDKSAYRAWVAVGLNDWDRVRALGHKNVLIDVANGYLVNASDFTELLQEEGYGVMVGNVHSATGVKLYKNCLTRVGIGNGSVCMTGAVSGYTRGQVAELLDCCSDKHSNLIIADGGIKSSGEAAKAFGLGADYVMMGGLFSKAKEAINIISGDMAYWGGASAEQLKRSGREVRHVEGRQVLIEAGEVRPLAKIVEELWDGISSAVSYSGYQNLTEFIGNGVFECKK